MTATTITDHFPHKTLPNIQDEPTYKQVHAIHVQLNTNAMSVPRPGSTLGYLGLTLSEEAHKNIANGKPYLPPIQPTRINIPPKATVAYVANANHLFDQAKGDYNNALATESALKAALLQAVPDIYTRAIASTTVGYASCTTRDLIKHLYTTYANITPQTMDNNDTIIRQPLDTNKPVEAYFLRLDQCRDYADAAGDPFTNKKLVSIVHNAFNRTHQYNMKCQEWTNTHRHDDPTYACVQAFFVQAHRDRKANAVTNAPPTIFSAYPMSAASYAAPSVTGTTVSSVTPRTSSPTPTMHDLQQQITKLTSQLSRCRSRDGQPPTRHGRDRLGRQNYDTTTRKTLRTDRYCWTHGYRGHTGDQCKHPHPSHVNTATATNTCGGSLVGLTPTPSTTPVPITAINLPDTHTPTAHTLTPLTTTAQPPLPYYPAAHTITSNVAPSASTVPPGFSPTADTVLPNPFT